MSIFRTVTDGLRTLFHREHANRELDEELRGYTEAAAKEKMRQGMNQAEALRAARLEIGGVEATKEMVRSAGWESFVETCWRDLRFAARLLRKNPGFTAIAVLTLALGIGVNAAIFGLVDSALLSDLPFREPERLVHVWTTDSDGDLHTPVPEQYFALQKYAQSFEQIAGVGWVNNFYGSDEAGWQNLSGIAVSANWLDTLGVRPFLGRNFREEEQAPGRDAVALLSYSTWRTRFHADREIVGSQILLNRRPVVIVGVLPRSLGPEYEDAEIVTPLLPESYVNNAARRVAGAVRLRILGRLKPGVTIGQARSETESIAQGLRRSATSADRSGHLVVENFIEGSSQLGPTRENAGRGLWMMAAGAGLVLLIACANVASLLLARGVKRSREIAVRSALGCSRGRLMAQFVTESTLLFVCGAGLGLLAARWSQEIITKAATGIVSSATYLEVNGRVFAVSLCISLLSALFFGMIPAVHAARANLSRSLKEAAQSATTGSGARRPRNLLVGSQVALGMVLLVVFGLLLRSMLHVESGPLGFDPNDVLTASVNLPAPRYDDPTARARLMRASAEEVRSLPGVESAGIADSLPMNGADSTKLGIESPVLKAAPRMEEIWYLSVGPEYFSTMKVPLLSGRAFRETDTQETGLVAVINKIFANTYFPGVNPIGYHVAFADAPEKWREIVGVISDFRQRNPEEDLRPLVYFPALQTVPNRWSLAIRLRASNDTASFTQNLRNHLRLADPQLCWQTGSMSQDILNSESLTLRRPIITLLASFGGLALALIVVGVFGVTSYSVAERTKEIGLRVALGADHRQIVALVLQESIKVAFMGLAIGALSAFSLARVLPDSGIGWSGSGIYLYGVSRTDAVTYFSAAALLMCVVLAASLVPARRAMRGDPMVALRHE